MAISQQIRQKIADKEGVHIDIANGLLDQMESLEKHIEQTDSVPHFRCHPQNPDLQKLTVAGRLYIQYSAAYRDTAIKLYKILCGNVDDETVSPLREFLSRMETR